MALTVSVFDAAETARVEAARAITEAVAVADRADQPLPDPATWRAEHQHPPAAYEVVHLLASLDGEPAGYAALYFPLRDNLRLVDVDGLVVHPAHRRRGVGRALVEFAIDQARRRERDTLVSVSATALPGGPPRDPAGHHFALAVGARSVLDDVRRRLDLTAVDADGWVPMLAEAWKHADGYSLVQWRDAVPDAYTADLAYLDSRLIADAPMGDLAVEPHQVDPDRVRAAQRSLLARRRRPYDTAVRHDGTGKLVGWTQLTCSDNDLGHAWQQVTLVDPDHRGHRLGLIVKVENLRYALAHEPGLRMVDTFNAAVNTHMISINEQLGFRPLDGWENWQLVLDRPAAIDG